MVEVRLCGHCGRPLPLNPNIKIKYHQPGCAKQARAIQVKAHHLKNGRGRNKKGLPRFPLGEEISSFCPEVGGKGDCPKRMACERRTKRRRSNSCPPGGG